MATPIKLAEVYQLISKAANKYQYAKFVARGTGKERCMIYRVSGSDDRSGEALPIHRVIDDVHHETLTVWDLNKEDYRRINLSEVISLVVDQTEYEVIP